MADTLMACSRLFLGVFLLLSGFMVQSDDFSDSMDCSIYRPSWQAPKFTVFDDN